MDENNKKVQIATLAMRLFKEDGFENVSIVQICKLAKINRNTFYRYFNSKDTIISEYFNLSFNSQSDIFQKVIAEQNDWNRYLKLVEMHLNLIKNEGVEFAKQLVRSIVNGESQLLQKYTITDEWCIPILSRCAQDGMIRNDLPIKELNDYANQLGLGIIVKWCSTNGEFDLIEANKKAVEKLMLLKQEI